MSILISSAPQIHGLPMALVTMAAWDVRPPREVRTPTAAETPWISSGLVSGLTRMTLQFFFIASTASNGSKTTIPTAAPGAAAKPLARGLYFCGDSICWCNNAIISSVDTRIMASSAVMSPSFDMSTAILTAAPPLRLPALVCRMYRRPASIVNSTSCMSPKWFSRLRATSSSWV